MAKLTKENQLERVWDKVDLRLIFGVRFREKI